MKASRKISPKEYLEVLQLEYLSYKLREKIFDHVEYIKMSKDIAEKKKSKINDLSTRFKLRSIFTSKDYFNAFLSEKFINEFGLPNFQYSIDERRKISQLYWDKFYTLKPGTKIFYKGKEYIVEENHPSKEVLIIDKTIMLPYTYIQLKSLLSILSEE